MAPFLLFEKPKLMNTWSPQTPRPESQSHIVTGVLIALAVIGAAIAFVTIVDRRADHRDDADLRAAITELHDARIELQASAGELRQATATLQEAARAFERRATTVNILDMIAPPTPPVAPAMPLPPPEPPVPSELGFECPELGPCKLPRKTLEALFENPASFGKQARIMPSIKDGETRGFKLYGIRPGSFFKALGFKNGDTVLAVNDQPLRDMESTMRLYSNLRTADRFTFSVERQGEPMTLTVIIE